MSPIDIPLIGTKRKRDANVDEPEERQETFPIIKSRRTANKDTIKAAC